MRYNVRTADFDPRSAVPLERFAVDLAAEPPLMLASWTALKALGGPATKRLAEAVLAYVPAKERDKLTFTVRAQIFRKGDFPRQTPQTWHTDYAHDLVDVLQRQGVHTYAVITGAPCTLFLQDSDLELPAPHSDELERAIAPLAKFAAEPWTIIRFNATELHTATTWRNREPQPRLFFRATYDPIVPRWR